MPIEHQVWFKWNDGTPAETIDSIMSQLAALKDTVPGAESIRVGTNFTDRSQGHTHGLALTCADRDALQAYATHPEHVKVVEQIKPVADSIMALDFEF